MSADINITQTFCRIIVQQRCLGADCLSWIWWNGKITIFQFTLPALSFPTSLSSIDDRVLLETHKAKRKGTHKTSNVTAQRAHGIHSLPLIFFFFFFFSVVHTNFFDHEMGTIFFFFSVGHGSFALEI